MFKIALLQLSATDSEGEALTKGIDSVKKAKQLGADIAVFPEMWNTGYKMPNNNSTKNISENEIDKLKKDAISVNSDFVINFQKLAKDLKIAIAITFLEKTDNLPKNTIVVIDRLGNIVLKYSKVHTVDFKMEYFMEPGKEFQVCELDYGRGKVNIGTMICFDRDFPESARILMLKGAEIILVPNACHMSKIRLDQLKVRAYENMVGIVTVNYANHGGKSSVYSPVVRDKNKKELNSEILVMGEKESIEIVELNLEKIRDYRKRETLGDAYRKPFAYSELINNDVKEIFMRKDSRRNL